MLFLVLYLALLFVGRRPSTTLADARSAQGDEA
jgi:hypothetical protein